MKRLILLGFYFTLTPIFLLGVVFYQIYLHNQINTSATKVLGIKTQEVEYKAIPNVIAPNAIKITDSEVRVDVLREYFERYNSPLADYAEEIVTVADEYDLDYRLIPAIAMKESTLCLKKPKDSFNCWGFGIYGGKVLRFDDYSHAIKTVSKALRENYLNIGLITPHEIMSKYTPSSDGSWAETVIFVMNNIEESI